MAELAITLPARAGRMREIGNWARAAEARGFTGVYSAEATIDSLVVSLTAVQATERISVGTAISNVDFRHPALAAAAASHLHELSGGRFVLGLGTSHRIINEPRGIDMGRPIPTMRGYVEAMRGHLGDNPAPPIYLAALRRGMARLAGEIADGVIYNMAPLSRFPEAVEAVRQGEARRADGRSGVKIASLLGACVSDDLEAARDSARRMIAFYYRMEYYRNQAEEFGLGQQARQAQRGWDEKNEALALSAVDDEMVDELFLVGPPERCRKQLQRWREAGLELPIVSPRSVSGDGLEGFRTVVDALAPDG